MTQLRAGDEISIGHLRLKVVRLLAAGGMGFIYLCRDESTQQQCVVKTPRLTESDISENEYLKGRIGVEYEILKRLNHTNIIKPLAFSFNPIPYLALEYFQAPTAYAEFGRYRKINEDVLLTVAKQFLDAVSYMHALNIIHRDLNPKNILVNESLNIRIIDFGTAKHFYIQQLKEGDPVWPVTAGFTAPEQEFYGFSTPLSDIYSAGATLYYIASGRNPRDVMDGPMPKPLDLLNPNISTKVSRAISKAMDPYPNNRFGSATEFLQSLVGVTVSELATPYIDIGGEKIPVADMVEIGNSHGSCPRCGKYPKARRYNIVDPNNYVSRHHVLVYRKGSDAYVEFIGSVNNAHIIYYDPSTGKPLVKKLEQGRPWCLSDGDIIAMCYHEKLGPYITARFVNPLQRGA